MDHAIKIPASNFAVINPSEHLGGKVYKQTKVLVACLLTFGAAGASQKWMSYTATDGSEVITLIAVCKATESDVSCWSPYGEKIPKMEAGIRYELKRRSYSPIRVTFGRKNRIFLIERYTKSMVEAKLKKFPAYSSTEWSTYYQYPDIPEKFPNFERKIFAEYLDFPLEDEKGVYVFHEPMPGLPVIQFKLETGVTVDIHGTKFKVRNISKGTYRTASGSTRPAWTVTLSGTVNPEVRFDSFAMIGVDGKQIEGVDENGTPISPAEAMNLRKKFKFEDLYLGRQDFQAACWTEARAGIDLEFRFNADPTTVSQIQVWITPMQRRRFENIVLDGPK